MSLPAPTFPQIRALVTAIRSKFKDESVIGIRTASRWTGATRVEEQDDVYLLRQCDSSLEVRIALREEVEADAVRILLTPLDELSLGEDVLLRLTHRRLFAVEPWQIVRTWFQAHAIDPRLTRHAWLAERLLEALPSEGCRPAPGGFLDAETVWPLLLRHAIGLTASRPDLGALLEWTLEADHVARFRALPADFRDAAIEWLAGSAGRAARLVLRCARSNERQDVLPVALAMGVVFHPVAAGKLDRAVGRMEERYLEGETPDEETVTRLIAAVTETVRRRPSDSVATRQQLQRADEILREVGAEAFAHLSDTSPLGFDQRLAALGRRITASMEAITIEDISIDQRAALLTARREVRMHDLARRELRRCERMDMAVRLVEWLGCAQQHPPASPISFPAACAYEIAEGGFLDWARLALRAGDSVRELSDAYRQLTDAVGELRDAQAHNFALLLRDWTAVGSSDEVIVPVERILSEVVAPLAVQPLLVVVMDGMSMAVARELLADVTRQDWIMLAEERWTSMVGAGLAAIPSVTEVSRASLLCGELCRGSSSLEKSGFARHPALLSRCHAGHPPIMIHKGLLQEGPGANLSADVRDAIDDTGNQIVGVVINAVDDQLLKGDQIATCWTTEEIKAFAALLQEARATGRLVILLSDHGHILESGTQAHSGDGGERWRTNDGQPTAEELQVRGARVVMPDDHTLIAPWSERVRYGGRKNGYHGGLTPQEMVVPIIVLCPTSKYPAGWTEAIADLPTWWIDPFLETGPRREQKLSSGTKPFGTFRKRTDTLTLEMDDADDSSGNEGHVETSVNGWIKQLLASNLFADQWKLSGKATSDNDQFALLLDTLDHYGGTIPAAALGKCLNCPPSQLNVLLASAQRILNIDGFAILTRDPIGDRVHLDRDLLWQQFDIG